MKVSETGNQKVFSIIMATFNCGLKVEDTLRSIFSQNRELFEVIVLDSASTDDTLDCLKKYENDLMLISEKDSGIYDAFNKGIDLANGKYIYFIGAGDLLRLGILDKVKESLPSPEALSFVYGKCYLVKQKIEYGRKFDSKLFIRDCMCQQGVFYHRELFGVVGKFDLRYKIFSDWLFNLRCFIHEEVTEHYLDYVIADYEEGGLSSDLSRDPVFLEEFPRFVKKQFGIYNYFICKAFLKDPYLFNYIYYRKFSHLMTYLISRYKFFGNLARVVKPCVRGCRNLKNSIKGKIAF